MEAENLLQSLDTGEEDLIEAETFDFDLSVSPQSQNGDEECNKIAPLIKINDDDPDVVEDEEDDDDEIFLGPVTFKEQCVAKRVELEKAETEEQVLTADQYLELFKEANSLVLEFNNQKPKDTSDFSHLKPVVSDAMSPVLNLEVKTTFVQPKKSQDSEKVTAVSKKDEAQSYKRQIERTLRDPKRRGTFVLGGQKQSHQNGSEKSNTTLPPHGKPSSSVLSVQHSNDAVGKPPATGMKLPSSLQKLSCGPSEENERELLNSSSSSSSSSCSSGSQSGIPRTTRSSGASQIKKPSGLRPPRSSGESGLPKRSSVGATGLKAPATKLSLLKPGSAGKPAAIPKPTNSISKIAQPSSLRSRAQPVKQIEPIKELQSKSSTMKTSTPAPKSKLGSLKPSSSGPNEGRIQRPVSSVKTKMDGSSARAQPLKATQAVEKMKKSLTPAQRTKTRSSSTSGLETPAMKDKVLIPRKRILSVADSLSQSQGLDPEIETPVKTPKSTRRKSGLPTPSRLTPSAAARRKSSVPTPAGKEISLATNSIGGRNLRSASTASYTPPKKKPAFEKSLKPRAAHHNLLSSTPETNLPSPALKPIVLNGTVTKKKKSPEILIDFDDNSDVFGSPVKKELFSQQDAKENILIQI